MRVSTVQTRRFTRVEYDRLIEQGFFDEDEPIELLDGLLVVKAPQGSAHVRMVSHIRRVLQRAFGEGYDVLVQSPIALDDASEPEPDLAVVRGRPKDHLRSLPSSPSLVVEVADSSLRKDRHEKSGLYARNGVADYWSTSLTAWSKSTGSRYGAQAAAGSTGACACSGRGPSSPRSPRLAPASASLICCRSAAGIGGTTISRRGGRGRRGAGRPRD